MPLFGNPAIRFRLTRGFASQPHGWFAIIGEGVSEKLDFRAHNATNMPRNFATNVSFGLDLSNSPEPKLHFGSGLAKNIVQNRTILSVRVVGITSEFRYE
jgi:hypothetical protein